MLSLPSFFAQTHFILVLRVAQKFMESSFPLFMKIQNRALARLFWWIRMPVVSIIHKKRRKLLATIADVSCALCVKWNWMGENCVHHALNPGKPKAESK